MSSIRAATLMKMSSELDTDQVCILIRFVSSSRMAGTDEPAEFRAPRPGGVGLTFEEMAFHRDNVRDAPMYPAAVFSVVLLAAIAATAGATDWLPACAGRTLDVTRAERPPDDDHYLANDIGGQVDHHVLWFGIDEEVTRRLRAAEVLFVGNSRLMFALRPNAAAAVLRRPRHLLLRHGLRIP